MTSTDRAFIAALQKASATAPTLSSSALGGPHYATKATPAVAKAPLAQHSAVKQAAPLSQHLARRRTPTPQPVATPAPKTFSGPFSAALEVETLSWPAVAQQLAHAGRDGLVELLTTLAHRRPEASPLVAVVGVRPGVGATTLLLALARVVGSVGGSTAIIDLTNQAGAATQLGVRSGAKRQAASQAIDDLAVSSREDLLSVIALGPDAPMPLLSMAYARLVATHDLVLVDAGGPATAAQLLGASVQVLLADTSPSDQRSIAAAQSALTETDIAGVVETFAPIA
jgi:Mrp family chromosome partitioning ATPase